MASIWVCEGAGVKKETTTINSMIKTSSQTSNTSQFVCQNQAVLSQKAPSITAFPFLKVWSWKKAQTIISSTCRSS